MPLSNSVSCNIYPELSRSIGNYLAELPKELLDI